MKKISTPIDTATSPTDTVIEMWGTKSPWLPGPIETSTSVAYTNVATNVPRVNCVPRSRMKLRSIRGTNSVEASVSVTIMIEKTTPTTVITAAARAVRIWRAASEVPWITHAGTCRSPAYTARSRACVRAYSAIAAATSSTGSSQRFVLKASRRHSETKGRRSISQWSRSMNTEIAQVVAAPTSLPGSPARDRSAGLADCRERRCISPAQARIECRSSRERSGVRITVLGKSPSWQDAGGACSGYLVEEGDYALLLDCGNGVFSKLRRFRDYVDVDAVVISHLHADHFLDLVPYSYALS